MKKIIKNKQLLIGLVVGLLLCATGVYAATVNLSSNVSYSNTTSHLTSNNVQGALDELFNKFCPSGYNCTPKTTTTSSNPKLYDKINILFATGTPTQVTTAGGESITQVTAAGLMKDSHNNIRYYGANPNNYVTFNGESWRIIGIVDGKVKLIRSTSIGSYSWDSSAPAVNSGYGYNNWEEADIKTTLNSGPYWNKTSGTCYNSNNNSTTTCNFSSTGLTNEAKNMIDESTWYLGGAEKYKDLYANNVYNYERGTVVFSGNQTTWTGNVGLMYMSDYMYATDLNLCRYVSSGTNDYGDSSCKNNNWLNSSSLNWTLSTISNQSKVMRVHTSGAADISNASAANNIRPTVYLKPVVEITGGTGTSANPYVLSMNPTAYDKINSLYNEATHINVTAYSTNENIIQASSVGLQKDSHDNIRYYGTNPNNYVTFNGEAAGWRIIGIVDDKVKLIKATSIGTLSWDNQNSTGLNNWENSWLKGILNSGLYWNRTSGTCYYGSSGSIYTKSCDFSSNGLTSKAKEMIAQSTWYLANGSYINSNTGTYALNMFDFERGTRVYSGNPTTWSGNVGLMYPSDYLYSVDLNSCRVISYNYNNCSSWFIDGWTITPASDINSAAQYISGKKLDRMGTYYGLAVSPSVYLKSSIKITGGTGTSSEPYTLG